MSRWLSETGGKRGPAYDAVFEELAASGADVHGEAAYLSRLVPAGSTVLDAGCGTGRVGVELARRGHLVTGVDSDASMLAVAQQHPGTWLLADLATLDVAERFDLVVAAGNVVVFLDPGSEPEVLRRLAAHLVPGGLLVSGWRTDLLAPEAYDTWCSAAGLSAVVRHSTWAGEAWADDSEWCVAVHRATGTAVHRATGMQCSC